METDNDEGQLPDRSKVRQFELVESISTSWDGCSDKAGLGRKRLVHGIVKTAAVERVLNHLFASQGVEAAPCKVQLPVEIERNALVRRVANSKNGD